MKTTIRSIIDGRFQRSGFATTKTHVGNRTLVSGLASSSIFGFGGGGLGCSLLGSPLHSKDHIAQATFSVGSKNLDGNDSRSLGDTVLAGGNGTRAMGAVPVGILVDIIRRYRLTPDCTTLKLDVGDADACVDDVYVNALATLWIE